jgi:DNA-binding FadR family transcriptional regulator
VQIAAKTFWQESASEMSMTADPRFPMIERERVADRVAEELIRLIAGGKLAPGERLPGERQLADMMGVSRVSVRAALQQLKTQGLVVAVQGGGTRVIASDEDLDSALTQLIQADRANLRDLMEIRSHLEVWAASRAAERAEADDLARVREALDVMSDPGRSPEHKAEDDHRFHLSVAKAAGSAVYLHLMTVLGEVMEAMQEFHRFSLMATEEDDAALLSQHRKVCRAIEAHDPKAAGEAMAEHLAYVSSCYQTREEAPDDKQRAPRLAG